MITTIISSQTDWIPLASVKLTITEKKYNNKGQPLKSIFLPNEEVIYKQITLLYIIWIW
jgi:hypothetical protein